MNKDILERSKCIIWHKNLYDDSIFTCVEEKGNSIILQGIQAWLWLKLSRPRSLEELRELLKSGGSYAQFSNNLEEAVRSLLKKKILICRDARQNKKEDEVPQKYKDIYIRLSGELNSVKGFSKNDDLNGYHRNSIHTINEHFELTETTVSHVYREPHPALGGITYGAKLYREINSIKKIMLQSIIVEVGAGSGFLARSFLDEYRKDNNSKEDLRYIFCDLTLKFLESQRDINKHHRIRYCQANAEKMPFRDNSVDLIIDNENIADFTVIKLDKRTVLGYLDGRIDLNTIENYLVRKSLEWIKLCSIDIGDDTMPEFIFNIGAIEFIKEISRVLKKGGLASIIEYGTMQDYPTAVRLAGHVEYSIQFSHLIKVIKALGMKVKVCTLLDFLDFDKDLEIIDYCSLRFIYNLLKQKKIRLPFLAYTREMLKDRIPDLMEDCNNLKFFKITEDSAIHNLNKFYVLLISKS